MAETTCAQCGQPMSDTDTVCPSCGAPATPASAGTVPPPAATPAAAPPAAAATSGASLATPLNLARIGKIIALLLFLLPWVTVSCQGTPLASASGFDLATGSVNPINSPSGEAMGESFGQPDWLILIGALLIVGGLIASFALARRQGALVGLAASAGAFVLLAYQVIFGIRGRLNAEIGAGGGGSDDPMAREMERQFAEAIQVSIGFAFWLCLIALAAAAFFSFRAMSDRSGTG